MSVGDKYHPAWQALWREYAEQGPEAGTRWTDPEQLECIQSLVRRWLETNDPQFMDQALVYCEQHGLPILPSLLEHVAASVRKRREIKPATKWINETSKAEAFRIMANLVARDVSIQRASEVAAVWSADQGKKPIKAGTLEREFPKAAQHLADELRRFNSQWPDPARDALWRKHEKECRAISDDELGNR